MKRLISALLLALLVASGCTPVDAVKEDISIQSAFPGVAHTGKVGSVQYPFKEGNFDNLKVGGGNLTITSNAVVANLNADMTDGYHALDLAGSLFTGDAVFISQNQSAGLRAAAAIASAIPFVGSRYQVLTGTADDVKINAGLVAAGAGARAVFTVGDYDIQANILPLNGQTLTGPRGANLKVNATKDITPIVISGKNGVTVEGIKITGNNGVVYGGDETKDCGVLINNGSYNTKVDDVEVTLTKYMGVATFGSFYDTFTRNYLHNGGGITMQSGSYGTKMLFNTVTDVATFCAYEFSVSANNCLLMGNFGKTAAGGVTVGGGGGGSRDIQIIGNRFVDVGVGITTGRTYNVLIADNVLGNSSAPIGNGINLGDPALPGQTEGATIDNNDIFVSSLGTAISIPYANDFKITNNHIRGGTDIIGIHNGGGLEQIRGYVFGNELTFGSTSDNSTGILFATTAISIAANNNHFRFPATGNNYIVNDQGAVTCSARWNDATGLTTAVVTAGLTVRNNVGYVTENTGMVTMPAGTGAVDVLSGMAAAATRMGATMTSSPGVTTSVYTSNVSAAGFTIYATTNVTNATSIDWWAKIGDGS